MTLLNRPGIPSRYALLAFLLTAPLSVRKVFLVYSPKGTSGFNEYTDVSLYLSDITATLFIVLVLIEHKELVKSIFISHEERIDTSNSSFVPRGTFLRFLTIMSEVCSTWNILKVALVLPLPFALYSLISTFWSESYWLALYSSFRLIFWYFLYASLILYFVPRGTYEASIMKFSRCSTWNIRNIYQGILELFHVEQISSDVSSQKSLNFTDVPRGTNQSEMYQSIDICSTWNKYQYFLVGVIIVACIQSVIGILQFFGQSSLGFTFLQESIISSQMGGIAKIMLDGHMLIRPYGLLPHPNVLAGFLGFTIIMTLIYGRICFKCMFHVEHARSESLDVPRGTMEQVSFKEISSTNAAFHKLFHAEQFVWLYRFALFVQLLCFLLTLSKSAYISLFFVIIYIFYKVFHVEQLSDQPKIGANYLKWFSKDAPNRKMLMFHVEHWFIISGVLIFLIAFLLELNWEYFLVQPIKERVFIQNEFFVAFRTHPFFGLGVGQSVYRMQEFFSSSLQSWQFQPIHNFILLLVSELGLVGIFIIFASVSMWTAIFRNNVPRGTSDSQSLGLVSKAILLYFFMLSIFDHYLWDIQQGQILFWLMLALSVSLQLRTLLGIDKYIKT